MAWKLTETRREKLRRGDAHSTSTSQGLYVFQKYLQVGLEKMETEQAGQVLYEGTAFVLYWQKGEH